MRSGLLFLELRRPRVFIGESSVSSFSTGNVSSSLESLDLTRLVLPFPFSRDKQTSVTPPSHLTTASTTAAEGEAPTTISSTIPDSHKTPPARHVEPVASPSYSTALASPSLPFANQIIPSVPARAISQHPPLQKSSSLPPALPSSSDPPAANVDSSSTRLATPPSTANPLQVLLRRSSAASSAPPLGPPAYETPVARNNNTETPTAPQENTPRLSLGTGSPASPLVGTPLSRGVGLGVPTKTGGEGASLPVRIWQANEGEAVLVDPQAIFVVSRDDATTLFHSSFEENVG